MTRGTPASHGAVDRFSTRGLPATRRIELWERHNAHALVALQARMLDESVLEAAEANLQLDRLHLAHVVANPHAVERTARTVRARPTESVALYFTLAGEAIFADDDGTRTLRPGQVLVCDADRPFLRGFARGLEELAVKVPYDVLRSLGAAVPRGARVIDFRGRAGSAGSAAQTQGPDAYAAALAGLLRTLAGTSTAVRAEASSVSNSSPSAVRAARTRSGRGKGTRPGRC